MFDALFFSNLLVRESTNRVAVCDDTKVEEERERERERGKYETVALSRLVRWWISSHLVPRR